MMQSSLVYCLWVCTNSLCSAYHKKSLIKIPREVVLLGDHKWPPQWLCLVLVTSFSLSLFCQKGSDAFGTPLIALGHSGVIGMCLGCALGETVCLFVCMCVCWLVCVRCVYVCVCVCLIACMYSGEAGCYIQVHIICVYV